MTGKETWSIIAPLIAKYVDDDEAFMQAYINVYAALMKMDEDNKNDKERNT